MERTKQEEAWEKANTTKGLEKIYRKKCLKQAEFVKCLGREVCGLSYWFGSREMR